MSLSVRNMVAILATIVILVGVFFILTLYLPTRKQARRTAQRRATLEAQVEAATPTGGEREQEGAIIDAIGMDIDFFKKRNLSPRKGIPELLEQINSMGSQMDLRFVAVKPLEEEDGPEYRRYPFLIETRAAYPELVNFVHRIENGLHLTLSDLRIETDKKNPTMHRLEFTINIFELEDELSPRKGESIETHPLSMDLVAVRRDPFSPKRPPKVAQLREKPKSKRVAPKKPRRPKLVLMGIVDIAGSRRAIIDNKILKPGEVIRRQRIDQIKDDHVILVDGDTTYALYLKGSTPERRREVKR